jgi:hypothetical protein
VRRVVTVKEDMAVHAGLTHRRRTVIEEFERTCTMNVDIDDGFTVLRRTLALLYSRDKGPSTSPSLVHRYLYLINHRAIR